MDALIGVFAGLALSAAVGFRVFVPLLFTGVAARLGYLELTSDMTWLAADAALVALATATILEVAAYYVPWLDNLLDAVATPTAIAAGVVTWAAVTPELSPLLRCWRPGSSSSCWSAWGVSTAGRSAGGTRRRTRSRRERPARRRPS